MGFVPASHRTSRFSDVRHTLPIRREVRVRQRKRRIQPELRRRRTLAHLDGPQAPAGGDSMNTSVFVPAAYNDGRCVPLATTGSGLPPSLAIV